MRKKEFGISIVFVSLIVFSCSFVKKEIKLEVFSPNGNFKIIEQSVGGGTATEQFSNIFVLNKNAKLRRGSIPVLLTIEDNILNVYWKDDKNILIKVKSEILIYYQVVKYYGFNIIVESAKMSSE